ANAAHRVDARLGARGATAVMVAAPAVGLGAMSVVGRPEGAALILTRGMLDGLWQPLLNVYMNRLVDSRLRATMLSLQSLVARLACTAWLVAGPFVLALLLVAVLPRAAAPEAPRVVAAVPAAETAEQGALALLAALQADGRLVDFLEEDLAPYGDEQVGGAARDIHDGCR